MSDSLGPVIISMLQKLIKAIGTELSDSEGLLISKITDPDPSTLADLQSFAASPEARLAVLRLRNETDVVQSLALDQNACNRIAQCPPLMQGFLISDIYSPISVNMPDLIPDVFYLWHNSPNIWKSLLSYSEGKAFFGQLVNEGLEYIHRYLRGGFQKGFSATLATNNAEHCDAFALRTDRLINSRSISQGGAVVALQATDRCNLLVCALFNRAPSAQLSKFGHRDGIWGMLNQNPSLILDFAKAGSPQPLFKSLIGWCPVGISASDTFDSQQGAFHHLVIATAAADLRFAGQGFTKHLITFLAPSAWSLLGADATTANWIMNVPTPGSWTAATAQASTAAIVYGIPRIFMDLFASATVDKFNTANPYASAAVNLLSVPLDPLLYMIRQEAFIKEFFAYGYKQGNVWTNKWPTPGLVVISNATPLEKEFNRILAIQKAILQSPKAIEFLWTKTPHAIVDHTFAQGANYLERRYFTLMPVVVMQPFRVERIPDWAEACFDVLLAADWQTTFWANLSYSAVATALRWEMTGGLYALFSSPIFMPKVYASWAIRDFLLSICTSFSLPTTASAFPGTLAANNYGFLLLASYSVLVNTAFVNLIAMQAGTSDVAKIDNGGTISAPIKRCSCQQNSSSSSLLVQTGGPSGQVTFVLLGIAL